MLVNLPSSTFIWIGPHVLQGSLFIGMKDDFSIVTCKHDRQWAMNLVTLYARNFALRKMVTIYIHMWKLHIASSVYACSIIFKRQLCFAHEIQGAHSSLLLVFVCVFKILFKTNVTNFISLSRIIQGHHDPSKEAGGGGAIKGDHGGTTKPKKPMKPKHVKLSQS